MRFVIIIIVVLFALAGIVFGALNADMVRFDVLFTHLSLPKGAVVLGSLVVGWVLGGLLVWLVAVQPLRLRLRRARKKLAKAHAATKPQVPQYPALDNEHASDSA